MLLCFLGGTLIGRPLFFQIAEDAQDLFHDLLVEELVLVF